MSFINNGVGPARIRAFELSYEGKPIRNWWELLETCCGWSRQVRSPVMSAKILGRVLGPGQTLTALAMERTPENQQIWDRLNTARLQIRGRVCYCSSLDDCWSVEGGSGEPESVPNCKEAARRPQYNSW